MSSRQKAPKVGANIVTAWIISYRPSVFRHMGRASMPAKVLKMTDLPSITGKAASGPTCPRPKIAEPSVIRPTVLPRHVYSKEFLGSGKISMQGSAAPGGEVRRGG